MGVGTHTPIMIDNEKNEKENELINGIKQQNEVQTNFVLKNFTKI